MKVKLPLGLVLVTAVILGYLLGTESGRQRRDSLVLMVRRDEANDESIDAVQEAAAEVATEDVSSEG